MTKSRWLLFSAAGLLAVASAQAANLSDETKVVPCAAKFAQIDVGNHALSAAIQKYDHDYVEGSGRFIAHSAIPGGGTGGDKYVILGISKNGAVLPDQASIDERSGYKVTEHSMPIVLDRATSPAFMAFDYNARRRFLES